MRIATFIDGNNYYLALRDFDQSLEIDLSRFATWVTRAAGGRLGRFVGAYYYTGIIDGAGDSPLAGFLDSLETKTGYFVRREPRVRRSSTCRACGAKQEFHTEKRVDTRLVAEMIQLAAVGAYDVACLLSGDDDFVPAVQAVRALGKQVYLATWPGQAVARELRASSFGVIDLAEGISEFSTGRRRPLGAASALPAGFGHLPSVGTGDEPLKALDQSGVVTPIGRALLNQIAEAESQLSYVSRWYFTNKWRGAGLPVEPSARERLIVEALAAGRLEDYTATDDKGRPVQAIRTVAREESSADGESASRAFGADVP